MITDISFEITQRCLNNCMHCSSCSNYLCEKEIAFDTIKNAVDDMPKIGVNRVCLSGGEPMLHKNLKQIVSYISQNNMEVNIYSSGVVGNHSNPSSVSVDEFIELKSLGLSKIMFNLQSHKSSTYDKITGTSGRFDIVLGSIKNAVDAGIYTEIHFVPMKTNLEDIPGIIELAKALQINRVSFLKLVPHGRAKENQKLLLLSQSETIDLRKKLKSLKTDMIRIGIPLSLDFDSDYCHAASSKLYIKFDGTVYGCEAFKYIQQIDAQNKTIDPNNILDNNLLDIYNNSKYLKETQNFIKRYSCISSKCESCPVQKYLELRGEN